jgi:AbiJ N-terminal domain 4
MTNQAPFSERQGYVRPREIVFRDDLPEKLRQPIINILRRSISADFLWERIERLFNPYGIDDWPKPAAPIPVAKEEDDPKFIAAKRVLLSCEWFRLYDLVEDIYQSLEFHDRELSEPDEEPQAYRFQQKLNEYFEYAGIGWQIVDGKVIARGDDAFERTVRVAEGELTASGRLTAAARIKSAIRDLSIRPLPDYSGAISHATAAMECVLNDVTQKAMTLGDYIKKYPNLFPGAMKTAFGSLWGYTSEEGARHGKEGVEPQAEEAEFTVNIAAALVTYLNRKRPRP